MRENRHLYASIRSVIKIAIWFLIGTGYSLASYAESDYSYDSSIQRSNFLSINPDYEKVVEAQIDDRRAQFLWKLRFDSLSFQTDDNINSQIAGATFRTKFNYKFLETLSFKAKANLSLESGRSQDIFGDQEPGSGIYPREVKIAYEPNDFVELDLGMIHQRFFNNPLFLANLGFIGASERFVYKSPSERVEVALRLQQLIPTSYTNSTRVAEREEIPEFYTESLESTLMLSRSNFLKGRLTHFRYANLPAVAAFQSFIYGNTVTNTDINNAEFIYGFDGYMTQVGFEQKFSNSLSMQFLWDTINNTAAPSDAGEAQTLTAAGAYDSGRWIIGWKYDNFFIESDAVPARYNSHNYGHNNRIGNSYQMSLESKDWGVNFKVNYVRADLLNQSTRRIDGLQQDNQQTFYIAVETLYEII